MCFAQIRTTWERIAPPVGNWKRYRAAVRCRWVESGIRAGERRLPRKRYNTSLMQRDPIVGAGAAPEVVRSGDNPAQFPELAQPPTETRVEEDMGTLAIHAGLVQDQPPETTNRQHVAVAGTSIDNSPEAVARRAEAVRRGDYSELTDAEVMLELKAGNMAAFDVLLAKYRKPIIHFMFRMVHNQAVAEELAQEVFLRVYRSRETYRAEARFSTWVYRIATNLGVNHARDTRHERTATTIHLDEPDAETGTTPDLADARPTVESRLLRDERMAAIREHVMALPERQRTAVLLHKYEGLDYKGIGEVLKLSESATKSLLFRAYQTLREKLKGFV